MAIPLQLLVLTSFMWTLSYVVYRALICLKSESNGTAPVTSTVESGTTSRIRFRDRKYNKQGYAEETDGTPMI